MYLCKFCQNPSTGSKDIASERSYADADGMGTKNNMSPTFGWGDIIILMASAVSRGRDWWWPSGRVSDSENQDVLASNPMGPGGVVLCPWARHISSP